MIDARCRFVIYGRHVVMRMARCPASHIRAPQRQAADVAVAAYQAMIVPLSSMHIVSESCSRVLIMGPASFSVAFRGRYAGFKLTKSAEIFLSFAHHRHTSCRQWHAIRRAHDGVDDRPVALKMVVIRTLSR